MIKKIVRAFFGNLLGLMTVAFLLEGFNYTDMTTLLISAAVLILVNFIVKPIVKFISFPINAVTLGVFGLFINAILLYITVYFVDGLEINEGYLRLGFLGPLSLTIQDIFLPSILTLIVASFIITIVNWLLKKFVF